MISEKKIIRALQYMDKHRYLCFCVPIQIVNGLYCVLACYLRAGKNLIVVHQQFLPYFSVDSSVEKKQGYASHHQLIRPASNLVFLAFFCHTGYSMALFPSFWLFPLMNCMQFITAFLPYFSVDSGVEKNQGYKRGHASHHQLVPPASKSHVILIFAQGRGPIFGVVVHKLP